MNNISWRQHYLPEFYLKGFTNADGLFKIFDVSKQSFIKNGKDFSTEAYFFEVDGNTVTTDKGEDDFIEQRFADMDSRVAALFHRIRTASDTRFGLTEGDMPALQHFISVLFWRIPTNYDNIKQLISERDLHEFGLFIRSKETDEIVRDEELESRIRNDPNFFKAIKLILPYITYKRILDCRTPLTIQTFPEQFPPICSDNPIIFESATPDIYYDNVIFPLTHTHVFVRAKGLDKNVMVDIKIAIDLIILKQAKRYVCCTDTKYVEMLNKLFETKYKSLDKLKADVFETLIEK
jgi:hypothetical protein